MDAAWGPAPLDWAWLPLGIRPFPTYITMPKLVVLRQTEILLNNLIPRVPPFRVSQGHWNRHGLIGYGPVRAPGLKE